MRIQAPSAQRLRLHNSGSGQRLMWSRSGLPKGNTSGIHVCDGTARTQAKVQAWSGYLWPYEPGGGIVSTWPIRRLSGFGMVLLAMMLAMLTP